MLDNGPLSAYPPGMDTDEKQARGRPGFGTRRLVKVYLESDDFDALVEIVKRRGQRISEFLRDIIQEIVRKGK